MAETTPNSAARPQYKCFAVVPRTARVAPAPTAARERVCSVISRLKPATLATPAALPIACADAPFAKAAPGAFIL